MTREEVKANYAGYDSDQLRLIAQRNRRSDTGEVRNSIVDEKRLVVSVCEELLEEREENGERN